VEARAKAVTDELRAQVTSLVEAMATERTVRAKQRGELDHKASGAAASVALLKGQLASAEELLASARDDAKRVRNGGCTSKKNVDAFSFFIRRRTRRAQWSRSLTNACLSWSSS
jgi:ABC-type transporter Mla subunit MlaD